MKTAFGPLIVLALLATPGALRAEPIPWTYSTTITTSGNAAWRAAYPGHVLASSAIDAEYTAEVRGGSGSAAGSRTVAAGVARPGASLSPDNPLIRFGAYATEFIFLFDIEDAESGHRGSLGFLGGVGETHITDPENPRAVLSRSESIFVRDAAPGSTGPPDSLWFAARTLRLGRHVYSVTLRPRPEPDGSNHIDADVRIHAIYDTPEPSTCILCGIGLAGVALRRRRLR